MRAVPLRIRTDDDAGFGLPELLVSMAIFSVVLVAVSAVFVSVLDTSRIASARTLTTADARIAMEAITRSLRVAVVPPGQTSAIAVSEANRIQFYASLDRGAGQNATFPTRVTYSYDPATGCVNENQTNASGPTAGPFTWPGAGRTKCLIKTSAPPVFTYFETGTITRPDGTTVAPVTPTDATGRARVVSVEAALDVRDPQRGDINGVIARDRVTLSNVQLAIEGTP